MARIGLFKRQQASPVAADPSPGSPALRQGPAKIGERYALLVGINHYVEPTFTSLRYCVKDVVALAERLRDLDYTVVAMHDQVAEEYHRPRLDDVLCELDRLCALTRKEDLLLVYLACHGVLENGETLLLMQDTRRALLRERSLPLTKVEQALRASKASRKVLLLDACHSGIDIGRSAAAQAEGAALLQHAYELAEGFALLASSTAQQVAQEWQEQQHGVFTYYLMQGLAGAADLGDKGMVTVDDLKAYLITQVRRWSAEHGGLLQEPTARTEGTGSIMLADLRRRKPPVVAPVPQEPELKHELAAPPPGLNMVIRFCDRTDQWQSLLQIAEQKEFRLVFVSGAEGEAHDYFIRRLLAWEGRGNFVLCRLSWQLPLPPRTPADYLAALADAIACPQHDVKSISAHLAARCQDKQLLLLHPLLYENFTERSLREYYLDMWKEVQCGLTGVLCVQPVVWERAGGLRKTLARIFGRPWFYPRDWVRRGATDIQALELMRQLKNAAPDRVHLLKELSPITSDDLVAFCENQGLTEHDQDDLLRKVLDGNPDSKVILDRFMEYLARKQLRGDSHGTS